MTSAGSFAKRLLAAFVASAIAFATEGRAEAQTKEQCIAAFDQGQELREHLKLRAARDNFLVCSRDACATALRKDCAEALESVVRDLPTVALGARDAEGRDLPAVRVFVDDERVTPDVSGRSLAADPGKHVVRFEHDGYAPSRREVLLRMGERNREAVVVLRREGTPASEKAPHLEKADSPSAWAYVFAGLGLAALGSFTYFAVAGKTEKDRLASSCGPACSDAETAGVRSRYLVADVSLGVGIVAVAAAVYFFLSPKKSAVSSAQR